MASAASKCLILGSDGLIGGALRKYFADRQVPVHATSRRPDSGKTFLDLGGDPDSWQLPDGVETAFLCAAQTSLKACEADPGQTFLINVERTIELARRLVERGAFVVYPSSNYVFDGSSPFQLPTDHCNPRSEYGRQKARAEQGLLKLGENVAVVRLTKIVHRDMALIQEWTKSLREGKPIHPFSDFMFSPVLLSFVADSMAMIAARKLGGVTQLSGDRDMSYEELARMLAESLKADTKLVQPKPAPPDKKGHATLNMDRAVRELGIQIPRAAESIRRLFNESADVSTVSRLRKVNEEVLYSTDAIVPIDGRDVARLKKLAIANPRERIRICAHRDVDDGLHEMLIVHTAGTYVPPHKHPGKSESFHIIEGSVDVVFFDDAGGISRVIKLGPYESGRVFYYRLSEPDYHTLLIHSEFLVFHETTNGPFDRKDSVFAPWAPPPNDLRAVEEYMRELTLRVKGMTAGSGS